MRLVGVDYERLKGGRKPAAMEPTTLITFLTLVPIALCLLAAGWLKAMLSE